MRRMNANKNDIVSCIREYVEFCRGVSKGEAIDFIAEQVAYDYELAKGRVLVNVVLSVYNMVENEKTHRAPSRPAAKDRSGGDEPPHLTDYGSVLS